MSATAGDEVFDYVVIGAGSAGCVVAARLSEDRTKRVLLLEAGPADKNPAIHIPAAFPQLYASRLDWNYRTTAQRSLGGRKVFWPRGRVLGGSSSINAMMWVRGMRADYDTWAEHCGTQWSYEAVLPYFRRAEHGPADDLATYGREGPITISHQRDPRPITRSWLQAASEAGLPMNERQNGGDEFGVALAMVTQHHGRRVSAADAYLAPAHQRTNLEVRSRSECLRILFDGRRAIGVEYRTGRSLGRAHARVEVISAAGAIGSPALLLRSGVGDGRALQGLGIAVVADRAEVGRHLQDHLTAGVAFASSAPATLGKAKSLAALASYLTSRRGPLTSNIAEAYGFVRSSPELRAPDLELLFVPGLFINEGLSLPRRGGLTVGAVLLQPKSHGHVALRSPDAAEAPEIDPAYLSDPQGADAALLTAGVCVSLQILRSRSIAPFVGDPVQPAGELDDGLIASAVRQYAQTLYHPVGTCRMGHDSSAVVDPQLRVRGVDGLRVVDASVMPQIIRGHTHAPTVMIAEKASELIAETPGS